MEIHGGPTTRKRRKPSEPAWMASMSHAEKEAKRINHWQDVSLVEVGLSVRVVNTLERHSVMTVGDLCRKTPAELRLIPNLGEVTVTNCLKILIALRLPNNLR